MGLAFFLYLGRPWSQMRDLFLFKKLAKVEHLECDLLVKSARNGLGLTWDKSGEEKSCQFVSVASFCLAGSPGKILAGLAYLCFVAGTITCSI